MIAKRPKRRAASRRAARLAAGGRARARRSLESIWIEPYPDEHLALEDGYAAPEARYELRESVELAFIAALQHLPARQRAVLILREVLGFSAREVAQSLDTTAASVNSALQRARKTVDEALPERSQQADAPLPRRRRPARLVERYVEAWESRDVDAMVAVLVEDVDLRDAAVPALVQRARRRDRVHRSTGKPRLRHVVTRADGQPAVAWYMRRGAGVYLPVVDRGARARGRAREGDHGVRRSPELFPRFGLPAEL